MITLDLSFIDRHPTGIGNYALALASALDSIRPAGCDLRGWDGVQARALSDYLADPRDSRDAGHDLRARALARLRNRPMAHAAARLVRQMLAPRMDLFHALNFIPTFAVKGTVIPTVYDLSYLRFPQFSPADRVARLAGARDTFRQAPVVHVISEFTRREAIALLDLQPERIFVIPPAVSDADEDAPLLSGLRPAGYILYVGALEPRKNLATLVGAYLALPDGVRAEFPLVLAGPAGWRAPEMPEPAERARARGEIRLPGYLSRAQIRRLMADARVFAYPSVYEGFGMPVLEALSAGTPAIVSRDAGLDEAGCGLATPVAATDVEGWRDALRRALHTELSAPSREALSKAARERFSWEGSARTALRMYDRAADSGRAR